MKRGTLGFRTNPDKSLVGFVVGDVRYAISVEYVLQVVNPMPLTSLPSMPPAIVGVSEHRGLVIPVIDMKIQFGMPSSDSPRAKWILLMISHQVVGLVVDAVTGVFGARSEEIRPAPNLISQPGQRGLSGVVSKEGHLVFLLDGVALHQLGTPAFGAVSVAPLGKEA